jgi:hypothetical protein
MIKSRAMLNDFQARKNDKSIQKVAKMAKKVYK